MRHVVNWIVLGWLSIGCFFKGHNYGTHFEDIFEVAPGEFGEIPWCDRCGRDQEAGNA